MNNTTVNFTSSEASTTRINEIMIPFYILIFCMTLFIGVPTHTYIMWHITTGTAIASRFFNLNFSVCEMGNSLNSLLTLLAYLLSSSTVTVTTYFLQGLGITGRPLFQCLICVEHYLAVIYPVIFLKFKPLRYKVICCTVAWIVTFGSCLFCMFILISCSVYIYIWFFTVQFLVFFSIQLFCCLTVLRALKQSGPGERGREREEENHLKRSAYIIILVTTISMVIMYVPYIIAGFLFVTQHQNKQTVKVLWFFCLVCFDFAGFVQPVLYLQRTGKLVCRFCP